MKERIPSNEISRIPSGSATLSGFRKCTFIAHAKLLKQEIEINKKINCWKLIMILPPRHTFFDKVPLPFFLRETSNHIRIRSIHRLQLPAKYL